MRQHPIPQNVLDVEFKLFTKFTLKEFTYLAIGIGIGGLFLYFTTKGQIPGIIGIPVFVVCSSLGAFFALVPINDQPADKFLISYFTAIKRPTQRVWLNTELKNQRLKPIVQPPQKKIKVIGGSKIPLKKDSSSQDDMFDTKEVRTEDTSMKESEENLFLRHDADQFTTISEENVSKYQFPIKSVDSLPGNINIWLCTKDNKPISDVNVYLKDNNDKILYANKTGKNGYFLTHKMYPEGVYNIEFEGVTLSLPRLRIVITKNMGKLPYKITES